MVSFWIVLSTIVAIFVTYAVLAPVVLNRSRFSGAAQVMCPERKLFARVKARVSAAALASAYGAEKIPVKECSLLGKGQSCNGACLKPA